MSTNQQFMPSSIYYVEKDFLPYTQGEEYIQFALLHHINHSLSAGLLRQATYTTMRLGIYSSLMDMFARLVDDDNALPSLTINITLVMMANHQGS